MRISQLAERVGVKPATLRFYERLGLLSAERSGSGYRLYGAAAVRRLEFITLGKQLGLPLAEIRDLLGVWQDGLCADVRASLRPMLLARIDDAEQRAGELAGFARRLRDALAELDAMTRSGPCGPDCSFLRRHQGSTRSVPVELGRPAESAAPVACSLRGGAQADRIADWRRLLAGAARERIEGGWSFRLATELAGQLAELAAAEQQCCTFFEFTIELREQRLEFQVRAPAEAAPMLAEVFGP